MRKITILLLSLITLAIAQESHQRTLKLMGSRFDITVVADSQDEADRYIDMAVAEIQRIEALISSWDSASETSRINQNAGIRPVPVSAELFTLIKRAIQISKITEGAFDISYASMDKIWKFDGTMKKMPTEAEIKKSVEKVGYQKIQLDEQNKSVYLTERGMKIGFGAMGKGYAADKAKTLLNSKGVVAGIVNASGDMNTWGTQPDGTPWQVAITNPMKKDEVFSWFSMDNNAVVTSGDYEKFVKFNGVRYTHIINPKTGYPATGMISATVFAPKAELADALATSIFVMGVDVGIDIVNQLQRVECVLINEKGNIFTSKNIKIERTKQ